MARLPLDVLCEVFTLLEPVEVMRARAVCQEWREEAPRSIHDDEFAGAKLLCRCCPSFADLRFFRGPVGAFQGSWDQPRRNGFRAQSSRSHTLCTWRCFAGPRCSNSSTARVPDTTLTQKHLIVIFSRVTAG